MKEFAISIPILKKFKTMELIKNLIDPDKNL